MAGRTVQLETVVALFDRLWQFGASFWRLHRFRAHVRIALDWDYSIVIALYGPTKRWRAISVIVTASKTEEFVIAKGTVEAKDPRGRWVSITDLEDALSFPIVVDANRQWQGTLSGSPLAEKLKAELGPVGTCRMRLILHDHHGSKLKSKPLEVMMSELRREERS
jgi:hypothetical protein